MSTKPLRRVDCATEKGENMKEQKSKGDFFDFGEFVTQEKSPIRDKFLDKVYKKGQTAGALLRFFHEFHYDGVSLEECEKLLKIVKNWPRPKRGDSPVGY